jgi:hypothetical protein
MIEGMRIRPLDLAEREPRRIWRKGPLMDRKQRGFPNLARFVDRQNRTIFSWNSRFSALSFLSMFSFASIASIASSGSILSLGSNGSILSIGSAGSILSIGSAGSILSIGAVGGILKKGRGKPKPESDRLNAESVLEATPFR